MKFDKILEYQKIDQELIALETEVAKSDERKKFAYTKSALDTATEMIHKLNQDAGDVLNDYTEMTEKIASLKAELDGFNDVLDDMQDATEADYYLKNVTAIAERINALEKEANATAQKIDQINNEYKKTWEQGVKATNNYKTAKAEYEAIVSARQPKANEINKRLNALKEEIPQDLMNAYTALRSAKKMPAFVAYDVKAGACGRCFMELPNDAKSKLRNPGDHTECPNCRRVLFIPEE